jgi:ketosteroid isomerase-like protein
MKCVRIVFLAVVAVLVGWTGTSFAQDSFQGSDRDRIALQKTGDAIRAAFATGDVDAVMVYHHRNVEKWLSPTNHLVGREAVRADLARTFQSTHVEFVSNQVESVLFTGESAVEVSSFTIRGTPKNGGAPSLFKGHAMVVYVRLTESPTGWASIRELIQPAS